MWKKQRTVKAEAKRTLDPWKWINDNYSEELEEEFKNNDKQQSNIIDTEYTTFYSSDAGENLKNIFVFIIQITIPQAV